MTPKRTTKRIGAADGVSLPLIMGNFKQQRKLQGMARKYMKIAMVGQKRVPSHDGGIEVVVGELAKRMVAQGHSVTCYNRTGKQPPQPENFNGISLKDVPTIQKKGLAAVSAGLFGCLCAALGNYDVVLVHA